MWSLSLSSLSLTHYLICSVIHRYCIWKLVAVYLLLHLCCHFPVCLSLLYKLQKKNCSCYEHLSDVKHISAVACQAEDGVSKFATYCNTWQSLISSHLSWNASETTHCRNMQTMIALHISRGLKTKADVGNELSDVWRTASVSHIICPYRSCISWKLKIGLPVVAGRQFSGHW